MALLEIPLQAGLYAFDFQIALEGSAFTFKFHWNDRAQGWYWSLYDAAGAAVAEGRRLVVSWPLLRNIAAGNTPRGELYAFNTRRAGEDPGLTDLGTNVRMLYAESGTPLPT